MELNVEMSSKKKGQGSTCTVESVCQLPQLTFLGRRVPRTVSRLIAICQQTKRGGTGAPLSLQLDDSTLEAIIEGVSHRILTACPIGGPAEQATLSATGLGKLLESINNLFFPILHPLGCDMYSIDWYSAEW